MMLMQLEGLLIIGVISTMIILMHLIPHGMCGNCHDTVSGGGGGQCNRSVSAIDCNCCHYHGSSRTDCDYAPTTRRTF